MSKRLVAIALTAVGLATGGYYYFTSSAQDGMALPTIVAQDGLVSKQAIAVGKVVPAHSVSIKSQLNGIVGEVYHHVGERVTLGTPLIKIRPNPTPTALTNAMTEVLRSEASLDSALQKLANLKSLVEQKVIPDNYGDYIQAKSDVKSAKADLQQKKQNLDLIRSGEAAIGGAKLSSTILAPIDGTILNLKVEVGEPIISTESNQAATEMMSMADMANIIFKGSVSEHDAAQLKVGMPASITLAPYPNKKITGTLSKVAVQSEKLNGASSTSTSSFDNGFEVEVSNIEFPEGMTLRSGFSATAKITLQQSNGGTTIPERALRFEASQPQVLIPDESEQGFHSRQVELGLSDGVNVEVISGLESGEEIIDNSMLQGVPMGGANA